MPRDHFRWIAALFIACGMHLLSSAFRVSAAEPGAARLPEGVVGAFGTSRFRAGGQVNALKLSTDGKLLLTRTASSSVRLWQVATGNLLAQVTSARDGQVVAWSADGALLAVVAADGSVVLLDGASGERKEWQAQQPDQQRAGAVIFSPDNEAVVVSVPGRIRAYSARTGKLLRALDCPASSSARLAFRDEGKLLDAFTDDKKHLRWKWPSGEKVGEGKAPFLSYFDPWDFNAQGHKFHADGNLITIYKANGDRDTIRTDQTTIEGLAMSHDGKFVVSGDRAGTVKVWSVADKKLKAALGPLRESAGKVSLSGDGSVVAAVTSQSGNRVRLWKIDGDAPEEILPDDGHEAGITHLQFARDHGWLLSTSIDGTTRVWDVKSRRILTAIPDGNHGNLSLAGTRLALQRVNGAHEIKLYDLDAECRPTLRSTQPGYKVALSPDGARLATLGPGVGQPRIAPIQIRDADSGKIVKEFTGDSFSAYRLAWCELAPLLACGSTSGRVKVWNVESGDLYLDTELASNQTFAFSPDGDHLVSARNTQRQRDTQPIQVWSLGAGKLARHFGEKDQPIMSCVVLPDNRRILAGGLDGQLTVWDLATGKLLKTIPGHAEGIYALALSPDGEQFASGSIDSQILLWDVKVLPGVE